MFGLKIFYISQMPLLITFDSSTCIFVDESSSSLRVYHGVVPSERPQELCCEIAVGADVVLAAVAVRHPNVHVEGGLAVLRREAAQGTPQGIASSLAMLLLFMPWRELNIS